MGMEGKEHRKHRACQDQFRRMAQARRCDGKFYAAAIPMTKLTASDCYLGAMEEPMSISQLCHQLREPGDHTAARFSPKFKLQRPDRQLSSLNKHINDWTTTCLHGLDSHHDRPQ
jgi:hypothetical protein